MVLCGTHGWIHTHLRIRTTIVGLNNFTITEGLDLMKLTFLGDMKKNKILLQIGLELSFSTYYVVIYKIIHVYYLNKSYDL